MYVQPNLTKPNFAIFLDIDGVFNSGYTNCRQIDEVYHNIFNGEINHTYKCDGCLDCSTAQAYLFEKSAVDCFDGLIEKITAVANLHIIISSTWRKNNSVDQLQEIFHKYNFSKFITDKTPDDPYCLNNWEQYCVLSKEDVPTELPIEPSMFVKTINTISKFFTQFQVDIPLPHPDGRCRASEINEWLEFHKREYIEYLIIDDLDLHLSRNFGQRFISTKHKEGPLLKQEDTEKAYSIFQQFMDNYHLYH